MLRQPIVRSVLAASLVCCAVTAHAKTTIDLVPVGDPGNEGELSGIGATGGVGPDRVCGAVSYVYNIGKYEITVGQYCEFLNAVADTDTYGLYLPAMASSSYPSKIERTGSSGSYTYSVASGYVDRPMNFVSWGNAVRFANWLYKGQPIGPQGDSTTEDGSYDLDGATSTEALMAVTRKPGATWVIPTEDEWYKAAYYDPNKGGPNAPGYWKYPTKSDTAPSNIGYDGYIDLGNHANYFASSHTIGGPYYRTIVGEFEDSESPYGTFDQGGNVWEWHETDLYGDSTFRGIRGGGFGYPSEGLRASWRFPTSLAPWDGSEGVGFRVGLVPEPGSIVLVLVGSLCLFAYHRHCHKGRIGRAG